MWAQAERTRIAAGRSVKVEPPSAMDVDERKVPRSSTTQDVKSESGAGTQAPKRASKRERPQERRGIGRGASAAAASSSSAPPQRKKRRGAKRWVSGVRSACSTEHERREGRREGEEIAWCATHRCVVVQTYRVHVARLLVCAAQRVTTGSAHAHAHRRKAFQV